MTAQQVTEIAIAYGGEAYEDNEIDAKILGEALTSLSSLIENAEKILHGEQADPQINIKATREGSFTLLVSVLGNLSTLEVLGFSGAVAAGAGSLMGILDWLRGRKPEEIIINDATNTATLVVDGESIDCSKDLEKLVTSPIIRKEIDRLVYRPLLTEQSSHFRIESGEHEVVRIQQETAEVYKAPRKLTNEQRLEEELQMNVKFSKLSFNSPNGWKMILPNNDEVGVKMADEAFLARVNSNQATFTKDDLFVVNIKKTTQEIGGQFGNPKYTILRVVRHRAAEDRRQV
ncbi:TPA: hypothetical protein QCD44_002104 [Enterobacter hormaechei]|uniref:Uncharacterized protein n=1 Tax=Enterobacter mori TaxID=539813 RepID=A0A7T0H1T1_9ENTR|nr:MULTISPECIES: hypothetical protein [Enterobacter]EAO9317119.1 hypothetical protein [Salmonella enterica]EJQ1331318.1 hypothetical protein [Cronobacter sakazakii]EAU0090946.1 hypothetical protein [Salmonella enterica]EJQ1501686.1 hypothetical protein [Cronobacter sakazakii]EJQ1510416.1 hypothetical protein [Cronobacter sakazakii]